MTGKFTVTPGRDAERSGLAKAAQTLAAPKVLSTWLITFYIQEFPYLHSAHFVSSLRWLVTQYGQFVALRGRDGLHTLQRWQFGGRLVMKDRSTDWATLVQYGFFRF